MLPPLPSLVFLGLLFVGVPYLSYRTHASGSALGAPRVAIYLSSVVSQWLLFAVLLLVLWIEGAGLRDLGLRAPMGVLDGNGASAIAQYAALTALASLGIVGAIWLLRRVLAAVESATVRHLIPRNARERLWFVLIVSTTAGFVEEVLYRGFAVTRLAPLFDNPWIAAVIAAAAFSLGHVYQGAIGVARSGMVGLVLAVPYLLTGSLWPSIIAHAVIDMLLGSVLAGAVLGEPPASPPPDGPRPDRHPELVEVVQLPVDPPHASAAEAAIGGPAPAPETES